MSLSVFEIIGPPMVGPSSSHTAGACRIGWMARQILHEEVVHADIDLHGSFLATGEGHGTREALAAGLLGMAPDDEKLKDALTLAQTAGLKAQFKGADLGPQAHPNSVRILLKGPTRSLALTAASIGGGSIIITEIDGLGTALRGNLETLLLWHLDTPGFLARITAVLACVEINVASIRTSRHEKGREALTAVEIDGQFPPQVPSLLSCARAISRLVVLPVLPGS